MPWLWYVAPAAALVVWFLTGLRTRHEARRDREIERWRALMTPSTVVREREGYRGTKEKAADAPGPRPVSTLPGSLRRLLTEAGGGASIAHYELVPKLAYVAVMGPDATNGSEYQAVIAKLAKAAPRVSVCPLPLVDGKRVANNGVQFKKDPDFMEQFLVEGPDAKAIGKWLSRPVRDALRNFPDAWLYVQDRGMALVAYGPVEADRLEELVLAADAIFAEHGADGAPSLLPDAESAEGDEDEDGDEATLVKPARSREASSEGSDEEEEDEATLVKPATAPSSSEDAARKA